MTFRQTQGPLGVPGKSLSQVDMDAMSHVTWIPHPQELVKLHVYFTKTSLTKELYVENKSLHQLTQDHPSKQLLKMGTSSKMNILQSELFFVIYVLI